MSDLFADYKPGLESPASRLAAVTPSDSVDLATDSRAIKVAAAGSVRVTTVGGDTVTVIIAAGIAFPVRARRIWTTGTTATGLVVMS